MSHAKIGAFAVVLGAWGALAGCCGGGPSHKCDFTPFTVQVDAGDAAAPCGTQVCQPPQVCCLTKIAPFAQCIDTKDYVADGCEKIDNPPCVEPADCADGTVCCLDPNTPVIACVQPPLCAGDGKPTYLTCASDLDCPAQQSGSCTNVGTPDAPLHVCAP